MIDVNFGKHEPESDWRNMTCLLRHRQLDMRLQVVSLCQEFFVPIGGPLTATSSQSIERNTEALWHLAQTNQADFSANRIRSFVANRYWSQTGLILSFEIVISEHCNFPGFVMVETVEAFRCCSVMFGRTFRHCRSLLHVWGRIVVDLRLRTSLPHLRTPRENSSWEGSVALRHWQRGWNKV